MKKICAPVTEIQFLFLVQMEFLFTRYCVNSVNFKSRLLLNNIYIWYTHFYYIHFS